MGGIEGVVYKEVAMHHDSRGWLAECFRQDEVSPETWPVMSYISVTLPGITRGPHEHQDQTDYFCFPGTARFDVKLWDNRDGSATQGESVLFTAEQGRVTVIIVPPGVVHAYKNVDDRPGMVVNYPNRLFAGNGRNEPVDEIRHEEQAGAKFRF